MFELFHHTGKRVMTMLLVIAMVFGLLGDYAPKWSVAAAEELSETGGSSNSEAGVFESDESTYTDGNTSDDEESSYTDDDTSENEESSNTDEDTSDDSEAPDTVEGNMDVPETAGGDTAEEAQLSEGSQSNEEDQPAETSGESKVADGPAETDDVAPVQAGSANNPEEGDSGSAADVPTISFTKSLSPKNTDAEDNGESADTQADVSSDAETAEAPEEMNASEAPEMMFTTRAFTAPAKMAASAAPDDGPQISSAAPNADPQISILQNMVNETLASMIGTLTGRLQVILSRNTTYEGDVTISAGDRTVADDFALELTAEDAGDDGMKGEGYTTVAGQLTIRGIKVVMNSVSMAAGQGISVINEGVLQYNGTQNANNVLNVTVGRIPAPRSTPQAPTILSL